MYIKNLIKIVLYFILDIFKSILWILKQIKNENFHNYIKKEKREKALAVFANGPSLLDIIKSNIINKISETNDIIFVNNAAISSYYDIIKPKYYIFTDPGYWVKNGDIKERETTFDAIITKTDWQVILYFPFHAFKHYPFKERFKDNTCLTVIPFHANEWIGLKKTTNLIYRKGLAMPRVQNVVVAAIFNGINLGYKTINLYGVEHSWTTLMRVNEKNQVCLIDRHYYDIQEPPLKPWVKIDIPYKMHEILRDLAYMFESYYQLEEYARTEGVKIINHTKDSFIDAFERDCSE